MNYELIIKNIRTDTEKYLVKGNIKSVVLGVSGGIDSALVAALIRPVCDKLNIPLIGRSISIESNSKDEQERALAVGTHFCTDFKEVDLTNLYEPMALQFNNLEYPDNDDNIAFKIRNGNIKARLRMIYLYNLASINGGLVLSTDNWTEYLLGFWTINGDDFDFGPIHGLWKTEVYEMADRLVYNELKFNQPAALALLSCIKGIATDGLGITNSDLDQILPGFNGSSVEGYRKVDEILKNIISPKLQERLLVSDNNPVLIRHIKSEFKRNHPVMLKRETLLR